MDHAWILLLIGFLIGGLGTLIGAGGGFILVPLLLLTHPQLPPGTVTAISIAIVACNAISGSIAYARSLRINYRAGLLFAAFTIPGSIIGVQVVKYVPASLFNILFGLLMIALGIFLFLNKKKAGDDLVDKRSNLWKHYEQTDREGIKYIYSYNQLAGVIISILVGFISPILGIGGGIIHVPALVRWLKFPVHIATATSHFILAIMSVTSVIAHIKHGTYNDPFVLRMVLFLCAGVIPGAQVGAYFSHHIKGNMIIRALSVCLALVGIRVFLQGI